MSSLHASFVSRIDEISRIAGHHFRGMNPEARDESIQNTLGLCWKYFLRLAEQGKADDENVFMQMIGFAITHTKAGRMPQGCGGRKAKCALDYARRAKHGVNVEPADLNMHIGKAASVPDAAAFRIDTPAFLATLSEKNRSLALDLASGMTTTEAARRHGVTPGAISQFRSRFKVWWERYHGEG